jgi:hypothetical protein
MPRLTLLLPPTQRLAGVALPALLARALGSADRAALDPGEQAQRSRHFRLLPDRQADAALTRLADTGIEDAMANAWLRVDPAYIRADINGARLLGIGAALGIEQADVDALLPALRPLFGDAGFILDAPHPSRWYLRLPREVALPAFASPEDALGDDVFEHLPDAPDARRWRVLASEAQVILHNHPHNAARLAAGKVPVNALWFWGGGPGSGAVLPDGVASDFPMLYSDDVLLHGIARLGKLSAMQLRDFTDADPDALLDLRTQRDPARLLSQWLLPAIARLPARDVTLDFADGLVFTLRARQRWRIWRRPLAALA